MILELSIISITVTEEPAETTEGLVGISDELNGTVFSTDMVTTHYDGADSSSLTNSNIGTVSSSVTDGYQGPAG